MMMNMNMSVSQKMEMSMSLTCGACNSQMGNSEFTESMHRIRHNNPHLVFVAFCNRMGACPICCSEIGSPVPKWVMSRAQKIWDGDDIKTRERCAPGALTVWDFK